MLTIHFRPMPGDDAMLRYRVDLDSPTIGNVHGVFTPPYDVPTWHAIWQALAPNFVLDQAEAATRSVVTSLGGPTRLLSTVGKALGQALMADENIKAGFDPALGLAESQRQPLAVELRFGQGCDAVAALPWELLHYRGRFLVADSSIALSRYPEGLFPPTMVQTPLPLRVLLVLSEPLDASPIFPQRAREELLHGLRTLDEAGAVIVDLLRPPTFDTLVEALSNGQYHLLIFYGHGVHGEAGGQLLFEDEFGAGELVQATDLGAALHNTDVRLVVLGACQSATVAMPTGVEEGASPADETSAIWRGTAAVLIHAGVPLAIGMQVSMRVDAAQAFLRQFALSLASGKPILEAVADARKPLIRRQYGESWFIPTLYGRPAGAGDERQRLFDPQQALPNENADLRAAMKQIRAEIVHLERGLGGVGEVGQVSEIAQLRAVRQHFADLRFQLARRTPGGYAAVTSVLYGVPSNPLFVGRRIELIEVGQALKKGQPVVIWGAGGLGKTALAIEVAHRQSWRYPGGVLWLDCRGGPALDTLLDRIAHFCGISDLNQTPPEEKEARVRAALAGLEERCLLIWDNAEDIWNVRRIREFARNELPENCQVLLTTRQDPEEAMWPTIELLPLTEPMIRQLFLTLATTAQIKVGSQADLDVIDPMLYWLEGHPLAVTLLVPLAKRRGLRQVWTDLQQRPLKGVEAAFAASYDRLTAAQQTLFTRLSVFTIAFERTAAQTMLPNRPEVEEDLDTLLQRALVQWNGARCTYHALLRQFAYAQLQQWEDVRVVHGMAAVYVQSLGEQRAVTPEEVLEEVDQWEKTEAWETFAHRASALLGSLDRIGYWSDIEVRLVRAQAAVQANLAHKPTIIALLLCSRAMIANKRGRWNEAILLWEQAQQLFGQLGDIHNLAKTLMQIGTVYINKGEWDKAIKFYQQAQQLFGQLGGTHDLAKTYGNLGYAYYLKGEWNKALEFYQQAQQLFGQLGDIHDLAKTYDNLGKVYKDKGEWDKALEFYQQAQQLFGQLGDIHELAHIYINLGNVYKAKGEWDKALEFYQQAQQTYEQLGDIQGLAKIYNNLGNVYKAKGEWDKAFEFYQQAQQTYEQLGDIPGLASIYNNLGSVYAEKGQLDKAFEFYQQTQQTYEQLGDIRGLADSYIERGNIYAEKGQLDKAFEFYQQAQQLFGQLGDIQGLAKIYNNLGSVYAEKGQLDKAFEFYQQAQQLFGQLGDIQGLAQTYNNLGMVPYSKGEWNKALEFYQQAQQLFGQLGDMNGLIRTWLNIGLIYLATDRSEEAKPLLAHAYLIFFQLGSPYAPRAANNLVQACGSVEAANSYLAHIISPNYKKSE